MLLFIDDEELSIGLTGFWLLSMVVFVVIKVEFFASEVEKSNVIFAYFLFYEITV